MDLALLDQFLLSDETEFTTPILDFDDRVKVHDWCEKNNLFSKSKGQQPNRFMVIEKRPREFSVPNSCRNDFIKENKLSIPITDSPYFEYYLDLYEKDYQAKSKYNVFVDVIKLLHSRSLNFMDYKHKLISEIVAFISKSDIYQQFLSEKVDAPECNIANVNVCSIQEKGAEEYYISVDVIKANYTSMMHFYPEIFAGTKSWKEFMNKFTDIDYFADLKFFRQIIFGKLRMAKNQALWKRLLAQMYIMLTSETKLQIKGKISDDELLIKTTKDTIDHDLKTLEYNIANKLNLYSYCETTNKVIKTTIPVHRPSAVSFHSAHNMRIDAPNDSETAFGGAPGRDCVKYWRITPYSIKFFAENQMLQKFYLKTNYMTKQEDIMGCNPDHKAQIYKAHKKMDMHEYDLKTLHNSEVVTFDKPMKFIFF
jgi:hypothetical protein